MTALSIRAFLNEARRRRVFRVAALYIVAAWIALQAADLAFPGLSIPESAIRYVWMGVILGLPVALFFGWRYDIIGGQIIRTKESDSEVDPSLRRADYVILSALAIVVTGITVGIVTEISETQVLVTARPAVTVIDPKSVAILPFSNISAEEENAEFLAFGIQNDLLTLLSGIEDLTVIARSSVEQFIGSDRNLLEIGTVLRVSKILQGSVQRAGNQIRINVHLIDAATDKHLWDRQYDRELTAENLFAIQSEISSKIAAALNAEISPEEESRIYNLPTSSLEAYNHYMHGRQLMATRRVEELKQALQAFEQAVAIDPDFALAWVGIADSNMALRYSGADYSSALVEIGRRAIDNALALDDQLGEAYVSLSMIYFDLGRHQEAEAACNKSIELSPNHAPAYLQCAGFLEGWGPSHLEKRLAWYYKAAQLDPLSSAVQIDIGNVLQGLGRYDEALDHYHRLLQVDPGYAPTYRSLGGLHQYRNGRLAEAVRWYRRALQRDSGRGSYMWALANVYISLGDVKAIAGVREYMDAHLDPIDWRLTLLDMKENLAQGKLHELQSPIDRLPPAVSDRWWVLSLKANLYLIAGDLQTAREYWLRAEPDWADPDQWQRLISTTQDRLDRLNGCNFAGILIGTGDEALGQDLLQQAIHYYEEILPSLVKDSHRWNGLGWCYLAAGSTEKALDFYEQRVAHGHISEWWEERYLPWWEPVRDHPRYIAIVNRIDGMLAEQRELLRQMDEADESSRGSQVVGAENTVPES